MGPLDWESSTLTTRPLLYFWLLTEQLACICSKFSFIVRLYVSVNNYIPVLLPSYDSGYLPNGKLPYFYWSTTKLHLIDLINPNLFIHLTFVVLGFILNYKNYVCLVYKCIQSNLQIKNDLYSYVNDHWNNGTNNKSNSSDDNHNNKNKNNSRNNRKKNGNNTATQVTIKTEVISSRKH